jgi:hypothetical protein
MPNQIFFISYAEPNADENWQDLKSRFVTAQRVHGVRGIHRAHQIAAQSARIGQYIWVVDGDSVVAEDFKFELPVAEIEKHESVMREYSQQFGAFVAQDAVYVFKARNPVNGLEYGYGGIKLLPRLATARMDTTAVDMSTSISQWFYPVDRVASITNFNTDAFSAWRSAFRECCKLASRVIDRQQDEVTEQRLTAWCTLNEDVAFGAHVYMGAISGRTYGEQNKNDADALKRINDFQWLKEKFNEQ